MGSSSPIWSFVPYNVAQDLLQHNDSDSPIGRERRFEAVALFADVSGFTAISEALGKTGKKGSEELTNILNSYFEPMIDLIVSYGGIIGKFGGDALTILFPIDHYSKPALIVNRAVQCAIDMQANMGRYEAIPTSAGSYSLAMKAGLALGTVFCTSVGYLDQQHHEISRLEYLIAGELLDLCAEAEHHATKGEVVIHNKMLEYLPGVQIVEEREHFSCISQLATTAAFVPLPELPVPSQISLSLQKQIAAYLHPNLVQLLAEQQSGFINEHRKVTVLFVSFRGFEYDYDPAVGAKLQAYLAEVIQAIHKYGGYLNKVDMGDKGSKYIVLFGAPVAHENSEERALLCALDLIKLSADTVVPKIGVNTGFVYCGQVGSAVRQEYTVMGDAVNLSARLMQAAKPCQVLVSGLTRQFVAAKFRWDTFDPIMVKGKSEPIPVFGVLGQQETSSSSLQERTYNLPMVGREPELAQAAAIIERVTQGRGQILGVTAEAGMGKSRLCAEIIKQAVERGLVGYAGECQSYGTNISYLLWRNIWQSFFGLEPNQELTEQISQLEQQIRAIDPALLPRLPLLGAVLNLPIPENSMTQALDAKLRKDSLEALLVSCLRHRVENRGQRTEDGETLLPATRHPSPTLLVLEDCHWLDPLSRDLLEAIALDMADIPVLILMAYRPPEPTKPYFERVTRLSYFQAISLTTFSTAETTNLVDLKLRQLFGSDVAVDLAALVERISDKAQGNPFYIEEMINYMRDKQVDLRDLAAMQQLDLPDSLHSLIISRVDQLMESEKITLKVASVLGRQFTFDWLLGTYPQLGTPAQVKQYLENLNRLDITPLDKPEPELVYLFKHIITQEVTYDSLAFALREDLHEHAGLFLEFTYNDSLEQQVDVLAYHFGRSPNQDKQRVYFHRAGDKAAANYNNTAAIDYYQRLLPLLPDADKIEIMLKLGEIIRLIGETAEAETIFRDALAIAQELDNPLIIAQCQNELGRLLWFRSQYPAAMEQLEPALQTFQALDDTQGISQTISNMGKVYWKQGNYLLAFEYFNKHLQIAEELNDLRNMTKTLWNFGLAYLEQGNYTQAKSYFDQQMDLATRLGDRQSIGEAYGSLGHYFGGVDYAQAMSFLRKKYQIGVEIGDIRGMSLAIANIAELYRLQGDYAAALTCNLQNLQTYIKLDEEINIVGTLLNTALVYSGLQQFEESEKTIAKAITKSTNFPFLLSYCFNLKAEIKQAQNDLVAAYQANEMALDLAVKLGLKEIQFKSELLTLSLNRGLDYIQVSEVCQDLEKMLLKWTEEGDQAAIYYEIWSIMSENVKSEACRQKAANLYYSLYVKIPNIEYRERYQKLTDGGNAPPLSEPSPLPPPPELIKQTSISLDLLLAELE